MFKVLLLAVFFCNSFLFAQVDLQRELYRAIEKNNVTLLKELISSGVNLNTSLHDNKQPIIFAMERKEREEVAKLLLENGADKDSLSSSKRTILYRAVNSYFSADFVRYLVDIGVDKNNICYGIQCSGLTAFTYAKEYRKDFYDEETIELLKPTIENKRIAFEYLKLGFYDDLYDYIRSYNNFEELESEKHNLFTSLVYKLQFAQTKVEVNKITQEIQLFLEKGFALNKKDEFNNKTPYEVLLANLHKLPKNTANFLFTKDVDVNQKYFLDGRDTHWTPLFAALVSKNLDLFKSLIKKGADINYVDENGLDLFYLSFYYEQKDFAKELIKNGYKIRDYSEGRRDPLAITVLRDDIEGVKYLLSLGFDVKRKILKRENLLAFLFRSPNEDLRRPAYAHLFPELSTYKYLLSLFSKKELNSPKGLGYHSYVLQSSDKKSPEVLKLLIDSGVDVKNNLNAYSPLQFLSIDGNTIKKIEILLKENIDLNHQDKDGDTPLHEFVLTYKKISEDIVEKSKRDPKNFIDLYRENSKEFNEILFIPRNSFALSQQKAYLGYREDQLEILKKVIALLIKKGADVTIKNSDGLTAEELVKKHKLPEALIKILNKREQ